MQKIALVTCLWCCAWSPIGSAEPLTIVDRTEKKVALSQWKIIPQPKTVSWIQPAEAVFEFRELDSTTYQEGIVTFIAWNRIQQIKYNYEKGKETAELKVVGLEKPLVGTARFRGINTITIEGDIPQGKAVATTRFRGGVLDGGVLQIDFPMPKPPNVKKISPDTHQFSIVPVAKSKEPAPKTAVTNLTALYRDATGKEHLLNYLRFRKTLKVELANITTLEVQQINLKDRTADCEVQMKDGSSLNLALMLDIEIDGKAARLAGLVGEVPAGYRLFPVHTFTRLQSLADQPPAARE
ncbi:MAG: hypothetical protein R3B84_01775 [Zavarzinella sp.]